MNPVKAARRGGVPMLLLPVERTLSVGVCRPGLMSGCRSGCCAAKQVLIVPGDRPSLSPLILAMISSDASASALALSRAKTDATVTPPSPSPSSEPSPSSASSSSPLLPPLCRCDLVSITQHSPLAVLHHHHLKQVLSRQRSCWPLHSPSCSGRNY